MRKFIEPLVSLGYRVWWFDAPGHGERQREFSNVFMFARSLIQVEKAILKYNDNQPIYAIIAHSLGCLATLQAFNQGLKAQKLVWIAPSMNLSTMFESYCQQMKIRPKIKKGLFRIVDNMIRDEIHHDPWNYFYQEDIFDSIQAKCALIYDKEDEEVPDEDFQEIKKRLKPTLVQETEYLGHYLLLKNTDVIDVTCQFIKGN